MSKTKTSLKKGEYHEDEITPQPNIAQPDPNAEDAQAYIKENAKNGESVPVPNVIGHKPVSHKLDS